MNWKIKIIIFTTGLISLIYWFLPVFQHIVFDEFKDRVEDHFIFSIPVEIFQSLLVISYGGTLAYIVQFFCFIITWLLLYLFSFLILVRNATPPATSPKNPNKPVR